MKVWTLGVVAVLLVGCSSNYRVTLRPESDMNQERSAVKVDLVWVKDGEELEARDSAEWFSAQRRRHRGPYLSTDVTLAHASSGDDIVLEQEDAKKPEVLSPPAGYAGFVVFARYSDMPKESREYNASYDDPPSFFEKLLGSVIEVEVALESNRINIRRVQKQ